MDLRGVLDDPEAMGSASKELSDVMFCKDAYEASLLADAVVLVTEWNEFRNIDLPRLQALLTTPKLLDCRNVYEPRRMGELGFEYVSVGRKPRGPGETSEDPDWSPPVSFVSLPT